MDFSKNKKLPEVSLEHQQEWNSIRKFKDIIEDGRFIVREEGVKDFGIDLSLEVILDKKYASNYRINIQIKDKLNSMKIRNKDLTYSFAVSIKTINYLLNSPNSIFVLYLEDIKLFVWEWVEIIQDDAFKKNINILDTTHDTYTYRFHKVIDENMKAKIYKEIITKAETIKIFNKSKRGIREIGNNSYDLNISINSNNTRKALKLYLRIIRQKRNLENLMLVTQYSPKELKTAIEDGVMTARLADGIIRFEDVDIQVLIGARELSVLELNELCDLEELK